MFYRPIVAIAIAHIHLVSNLQAQHDHLLAGASEPVAGSPLEFVNGDDFAAESGYVKSLPFAELGPYAGFYQGTLNPIALFSSDFGAATRGAFIELEIVEVRGPEGATFSYWESRATSPSFNAPTGSMPGIRFPLSENDKTPNSDPGGHIHGRRFTVDQTGVYSVFFRLWDTSSNGADGGSLHPPSELLEIRFQAGINILSIRRDPSTKEVDIEVAAPANLELVVESTVELGPESDWAQVGESFVGSDAVHVAQDEAPGATLKFYRLRQLIQ